MKRSILGVALAGGVLLAGVAWSQDSPMHHGEMGKGEGMKGCMQMMADTDTKNAELDALVTRMQGAEGAEKVAAIEEVVTALVAQRRAMHQRMKDMPQMMCGGMMMR